MRREASVDRKVNAMPMKSSTKLVKVLLTNIPIAVCISLVASYIGISSAGVPEEAFMPAFLSTAGINIVLAYIISFFIGWFIPAEKWGFSFAGLFGLNPGSGLPFGLVLNIVVNTVYVVVNAVILTFVNANVMQGMPIAMFPMALMGSFLQCWVVGYVVSLLWAQPAEGIARKLMNDPAPQMH